MSLLDCVQLVPVKSCHRQNESRTSTIAGLELPQTAVCLAVLAGIAEEWELIWVFNHDSRLSI